MPAPEQTSSGRRIQASLLMHRQVRRRDGTPLGRISDLVVEREPDGRPRVAAAMVTDGPWGRLLGYTDPRRHGPWPLAFLAHLVIGRKVRTVPIEQLHAEDLPS